MMLRWTGLILFIFAFLVAFPRNVFPQGGVAAKKALPRESFAAKELDISFYSQTPIKSFQAHSTAGSSSINPAKQEVEFSVEISSFSFYRLLMQEHFNSKFMESHRYPKASFKGYFVEPVDFSRKGKHQVKVEGILDIHGKKVRRVIGGTLEVAEDAIRLTSDFEVPVADHGINIPASLKDQIAPGIRVKVRGTYAPYNHLVKK